MPFAVKKPHPQHSNVKVWHSWDPDGDGYEEIRKFKTKERAQQWVDENHPTKNCEIVEIAHEIGQDDEEIERKDQLAEDPTTPRYGFWKILLIKIAPKLLLIPVASTPFEVNLN